jgi:hypothetical protein
VTGRLAAWLAFIALFSTVSYYYNFSGAGNVEAEPLYHWSFFASSLFGFALMVGVALLISIGLPKREVFALRAPPSWGRAIGIGFAVLVAVFMLSALLGQFLNPGQEQGLLPDRWPPPDWVAYGFNASAVVLGAPIAEELMFRGVGYSLLERFGPRVAIGGSAFAWALAHGLVQAFPLIFALGLGLGFLRRVTGSIVPGMLLHATFNGIALVAAAVEASH